MNIEDDVHITRVQRARVKCYIYRERDRHKIQEVIFLWYETL